MVKPLLFLVSCLIVLGALLGLYALMQRENAAYVAPAVPEPTKEEILPDLRALIMPLHDHLNAPAGPAAQISEPTRDAVLKGLADAKLKYGETQGGKEAFKELADEVSGIALGARDKERWRLVQACVDAYEVLGMQSVGMQRMDRTAGEMLAMPKVKVDGIVDDPAKDTTYVLMRLVDRSTGLYERRYARIGEEVDSLKILEIVGDNSAVRFEYMKIPGLQFEVETF